MNKINEIVLWTTTDQMLSLNVLDDGAVEVAMDNDPDVSINAETLEHLESAIKEANRNV